MTTLRPFFILGVLIGFPPVRDVEGQTCKQCIDTNQGGSPPHWTCTVSGSDNGYHYCYAPISGEYCVTNNPCNPYFRDGSEADGSVSQVLTFDIIAFQSPQLHGFTKAGALASAFALGRDALHRNTR